MSNKKSKETVITAIHINLKDDLDNIVNIFKQKQGVSITRKEASLLASEKLKRNNLGNLITFKEAKDILWKYGYKR